MHARVAATGEAAALRVPLKWERVFAVTLMVWLAESLVFLFTPTGPLISDMAAYWNTGTSELHTHVLSTYWPPLYPLITIPFHHFGGPMALGTAQTIIMALAIPGIAWYLTRSAGKAAGAIFLASMAVFPILLLYARFVLTDDWLVLALFGWVLCSEAAERSGRDWLFLASGICLGIGAAIRPEPVAVGALAVVWLLLRRRWRPALYTALPIAAEATGLAAYTRAAIGVTVSTQGGFWQTLWQGNHPGAFGLYQTVAPSSAAPAVFRHLFLTWLAAHPLRFVLLCLARTVEFWFSSPSYIQLLAVYAHIVLWAWLPLAVLVTVASTVAFFVALLRLHHEHRLVEVIWPLIGVLGNWWFCIPFLVGGRFREDAVPLALYVVAVAWAGARVQHPTSSGARRTIVVKERTGKPGAVAG